MAGFSAFSAVQMAPQCAAFNPLMPGGVGFHAQSHSKMHDDSSRTLSPIVTGTGVLGIKYKDGVMLAADTLGSYGSLAMFPDVRRLAKISDTTLLGGSGDLTDVDTVVKYVKELSTYDKAYDDGCSLTPKDVHQYLGRVMYNRRNKFDPLWNETIVAGYRDGKAFLGVVDLIGTMYEDDVVSTGFASYVCLPLLRKAQTDLSKEDARKVLEDCLRILFYRNCRSSNRIQIATVSAEGVEISEPYRLTTYWGFEGFKHTEYHGQKER